MDETPPTWLRDACVFIERNAANGVSVDDVASAVTVTPTRLMQAFSHYLGFTPAELQHHVVAFPIPADYPPQIFRG
jgi:transcriptional regulator GlxA family with amidase domain